MSQPLICVIVPVYNAEKYLDKCIESVLSQTYKNLEIILIDDGSPDNCPQICDKWAKNDGRIKVIHKENGGVSSARNAGLDKITGEYITFIDSDDWIEQDYISTLLENALTTGADVVVYSFTFENLQGDAEKITTQSGIFEKNDIVSNYLLDKIRPEACGKLINSQIIKSIRFDESFGYAEDLLFNYEVFKQCTKISCINSHKYHYLQESGNSSTTAVITENRANAYKIFEKILLDNAEKSELYPAAVWRFTVAVLAILSRVMRDRQISEKYYYEIVNAVLKYKKSIFRNSLISTRHKLIVLGMSVSPKLMLKLFKR